MVWENHKSITQYNMERWIEKCIRVCSGHPLLAHIHAESTSLKTLLKFYCLAKVRLVPFFFIKQLITSQLCHLQHALSIFGLIYFVPMVTSPSLNSSQLLRIPHVSSWFHTMSVEWNRGWACEISNNNYSKTCFRRLLFWKTDLFLETDIW